MDKLLKENEVLDDLQLNNLKIIQDKNDYRFSSDSVLLANYAKPGRKDSVVEFCSGSGVISILVNEKCHPKSIVGFEIQDKLCDMSNRSLVYNKIENVKFVNCSLSDAKDIVGVGKTDVLICNPPYYQKQDLKDNINEKYKLTKYEISTNLDDIFCSAKQILKYSGKFYLVHISSRIQDILTVASKYRFECKKIKFVYPNANKTSSHLVLMCLVKNGNPSCLVEKPMMLN